MSAIIYNGGGATDNLVSVYNQSICRPFSIAGGWNRIRIGIRWNIYGTSTNITGYPRAAMGLSNGNIVFNETLSTATHFLGLWGQDDTSPTGEPSQYVYGNNFLHNFYYYVWGGEIHTVNYWKVENGVSTNVGSFAYGNGPSECYDTFHVTILDITKGSPNWSISSEHLLDGFDNNILMTTEDLERGCNEYSPDYLYNNISNYYLTSTPTLVPIDEGTYGTLDTFCFYWSNTSHAANIHDIIISKIN